MTGGRARGTTTRDRRSRRAYLATIAGAAAASVAGCLDDAGGPSAGTGSPTATDPPGASGATRLVLDAVDDVAAAAAGAPLVVYPSRLQEWLRRAARTGETVRGHDETRVYVPRPVLPRFDAVRLATPNGVMDGTYDLTAEGGTRYRLLVGADPTDPPPGATVVPVAELPAERREFALAAIDAGERATAYPETRLGEWVRHEFVGGYVEHEGETYRGTEIQQTDAAFFSETVWYVLALSSTDGPADATLGLPEFDAAVRDIVEAALDDVDGGTTRATYEGDLPDDVVGFARGTAYLLAHTRVYAVSVE